MGSPSFPVINGQVKTPLRWYASEQELNEVRPECNEADKPECGHFALLSPADSLPPFQVWSAPGPGIVSAWTLLYASDGTVAMDLADEIPQLRSYLFASASYTIYGGETLATIIAQDTYRMTMVIDGVTYYSERFRIGCSGLLVNEEFEDMVGWRPFGTGITVAVDSVVMPGNPDAGDYEAGDYVINLGDNQIYDLLNDGVTWRSGTPDNGTYFYNSENGQWYEYQDGFQEITAPVQVGQVNGDWQMCWVGLPAATMVFDLAGILSVFTTYVFEFEIGNATTGKLVVTGPGFTFESTGNETVEVEQYLTYADVVGLQPVDGWDGCITRMTIRTRQTFEECAGELRWRHCSPVGNTYYGQNYFNKYYFDRLDATLSSEVTTVIETKEDSRRRAVETLRRKDVDWTLVLGYLPWYLEDSLTEVPMVDTIELRMPGRAEYDVLEDVRVVAESDEIGDACLKLVSLKFRLQEASVSTGCCGPFDAPCDAPCVSGVLGFTDDPAGNGPYIYSDSPEYSIRTGGSFGAAQGCSSRIVNTDASFGSHRLLYWTGLEGGWLPLCEITEAACNAGVLSVTANMQGSFSGRIQYSTDGGGTWVDDAQAYTASELGSGVEIEVPASGDVRVKITGLDGCLIGYSTEEAYTCA